MSRPELDALVAEATVDCHNDEEQLYGLYTAIEENLTLPFTTQVLGMDVTVENIELTDSGQIVGICRRSTQRQAIGILDLPLPTRRRRARSGPRPTGAGPAEGGLR